MCLGRFFRAVRWIVVQREININRDTPIGLLQWVGMRGCSDDPAILLTPPGFSCSDNLVNHRAFLPTLSLQMPGSGWVPESCRLNTRSRRRDGAGWVPFSSTAPARTYGVL